MANIKFSQIYSHDSKNSDNDQTITLSLETERQSSLFLDQKEVYDHYIFLEKNGFTNPNIAKLINLIALALMCLVILVGIVLSIIFAMLGIFFVYKIITNFDEISSSSLKLSVKILEALVCFIVCIFLINLTGYRVDNWKLSFKIRILYICHANRLLHFAPGYKDYHENTI